MTRSPLITRGGRACLGSLLLVLATLGASAASPKRVLLLNSFGRDVEPYSAVVSPFRTTLARELGEPVDIYETSLDMAPFADRGFEQHLVDFIERRFAGRPVDLVVPVGAPAARFAVQYRERLFREVPVLFAAADPRTVPPEALRTNATLVTQNNDLPGMVEDILQMQPDTTNIVVVFGASPLEKFWADECRREWRAFTNRVGFTWLNALSLPQIRERVQKLPPHSFIFFGMLLMDAEQVPYYGGEALKVVHAAANAPIFGCFRSQFGLGTIGGRLCSESRVGAQAATVAVRILRGEKPADIPPEVFGSTQPAYDWRELTRWGISPNRLPAGSLIEFREPTFWEQYRWSLIGILVFCGLQTVLIIGLLVSAQARRRAERAWRESEERMTLAAEAAQFGVWGWNLARNQVWGSERWLRLFGFASGQDVSFEDVIQRIHPDDRETVEREVWLALAKGADYAGEFRAVLPDGAQRWIACRGRGHADAKGTVSRMLGTAIDTTERKQAQQDLAQLQRRNELILESAAEGILGLDSQGNHVFVNPAAARMLGYDASELLGRRSHRLWHHTRPDGSPYPEEECKIYASFVAGQTHRESAEVFWRKDGTSFPVEYVSTPIYEQGRLLGAVVTFQDITASKRAEEALRASEETNRVAFEQAAVGIAQVGIDGRWLRVNDRLCSIVGYPRDELLKLTSQEITHPEDLETDLTCVRQVLSGEIETYSMEKRLIRKDRSLVWVLLAVSLVRTGAGERGHFISVAEDITERKRAEALLRDLSGRLIDAQEQERARLARELHDGLSQNLALQAVELELMGQQPPTDAAEITRRLQELSAQMKKLSTEVHRISRDLHPAKLTQLGLVAAIAEVCHSASSVHQIPVSLDHRGIPRLLPLGVALCLYRVTQESIQNVVKHSGAKQARVELTRVENTIHLCVVDDGRGFDVESNRDTNALGLVSMGERVRLVQGRISIQSRPGEGTRIEVWVPIRPEAGGGQS